ncbi:LysR family transcriptional regulator [Shewanella sp. NIFS-20-20]|uniref:LysR family transcriptional regulator n=1 Tax=Shewanella sp. NIFS-20-20 TaxID=2853806 RepID=UPI001C449872|nr:LysR family transcriptional regulator [Shewanella sp. NIFS-20-20]MBV7314347.1 LysR family transcriptional regulator [Shewanella sp. NIFS-20-20]
MDTDLLKTFLEVSRTRHFGKAADNLYLTRSAVSFRVKQLESLLGVALFERQRNNIHPTYAGERMLVHAEAVLTAWERAKQDVSLSEQHSIQLAIGTGPNIWETFLKRRMQRLYQGVEGVALRTDEKPNAVVARQLLDKTLDISITLDPPQLDELEQVAIGQLSLVLVSSQAETDVESMANLAYVKVDWGTAFNSWHAQHYSFLPVPMLQTSSADMALNYLLAQTSMAFLPLDLVEPYLAAGQLHVVRGASGLQRNVYLTYWPQSSKSNEISAAIDLLSSVS